MAALFADGNNSRSSFDFLVQTAEASAAKAQQVLKPFSSPAVKDSGRPEHTATEGSGPGPAEGEGANGKARRSVIMQNKRLNRYNPKAATTGTPIGTPSKQTATPSTTPTKSTAPNSAASPPRMGTTEKKLDEYGFITNMDRNGTVYDDVMNSEKIPTFAASQLNEKREKKWAAMISSWDVSVRRRNLTSRRLRKGVPNSMRGKVWALLGHVPSKIKANPGKYDMMVQQSLEASSSSVIPTDVSAMIANNGKNVEESRTSLANSKTFRATQETIERDIHRTYPRHGMFHDDATRQDVALDHNGDADVAKMMAAFQGEHPRVKELLKATGGQASLRRVLRAYSVHDLDVGYCQGMNFIAGMFLTFMTEEESFWLLVAVMNDKPCRMRGLFGEGMQETHQVLHIAEKLTHQFLPKLAKHLEKESVHITMYATQWLLTLYTSSFEFDLVTRVWDCFLSEGWKVVYRVMLALLQHSQSALMTLSFEDILAFFRELPDRVNGSQIMDIALKIPLRHRHLEKYEKEWKADKATRG